MAVLSIIIPGDKRYVLKFIIKATILIILVGGIALGQFKSRPDARSSVSESIIRQDNTGLLFGWFDPSRLTVHNSYTLSYTAGGGRNFSIGSLTSSLAYQISNPLSLEFDLSLMHSPYNNLGDRFTKDITGLYLTRAALNYRPSKSTLIQIQFQQIPSLYWLNNYDRFGFMSGFNAIEEEESR